jgi:hypothetical protein
MSRQEVAYRMSQSDTDLRDAYCLCLSAARRFSCTYVAATHAAAACLGELNVDHRDDLESFAIIAAVLNLEESAAGTSANMVRLYRAQMRAFYDGASPVDISAVDQALDWAQIVVAAVQSFFEDPTGMEAQIHRTRTGRERYPSVYGPLSEMGSGPNDT